MQAEVLAERIYPPDDNWEPHMYSFVECVGCKQVLVGYSEYERISPEEDGWGDLIRQWPEPVGRLHSNIPRTMRRSIEEARRCYGAEAYMACAVMCGRAVEGICKDKVVATSLYQGLKKLNEQKIIDEKLLEWGDALRAERNIGAHAGEEEITAQDAADVLEFAVAISEYVYVLADKYDAYKARKANKI